MHFADHAGAPGASDREPAAPVGPPHHLHRAHQEPLLQVLAARVRHLRPRDPEALRVRRQVLHGAPAAARAAAGRLSKTWFPYMGFQYSSALY